MKNFLILFLFAYTTIGFSQTEQKSFNDKLEEFEYIAKPSPTNDLSRYFKREIDYSLLNAYKIDENEVNKNHIYLTFKLNQDNKVISVFVTTPYSELNKKIIDAFREYDIDKLNIPEKSTKYIYALQILYKDGDKMVVNCSTNIIYDSYPVYEGCESSTYSQMKSCINKLLEAHIVKNISPDEIKKAKVLGLLTLKPKFIINEKGAVELIPIKTPNDSLSVELNRVLALFPNAKIPPLRNGKPTKLTYSGYVKLQIDTENKEYVADVIKSKDSTLNPNNELALHFKKFISENELNKVVFRPNSKSVNLSFSIDKKGKVIDIKANSLNKVFDNRLIEVFKNFPFEKLNINSTNVLEIYNYTIISKAYPVNIIQCNDKPNISIPPYYDKHCEKSDSPVELMKCFNERISTYIVRNFDANLRSKTKLTGDLRISCSFQVDVDAKIINVKVKAPNPSFANEMEEMLKDMPAVYKPAYMNGKAIKMSFLIPVVFKLGDNIPVDPFKSINKGLNKPSSY